MNMGYDIKSYQRLPIDEKVKRTKQLITDFYKSTDGKVYISFSGGIDSTVLLYIARELFPDIKAVFSDTGLEYPEIRKFVKTHDNVIIVKPKMRFDQVIASYGYPVISKEVSKNISRYRNTKSAVQKELRLNGGTNPTSGKIQKSGVIPKKYHYLIDAPFKISDMCCHHLKKEPLNTYSKHSCESRIIGIMADESSYRQRHAIKYGEQYNDILTPLIFWTRQDILNFVVENNIPFCNEIYRDIIFENRQYKTTKEKRTGCMFCMFGVQLEEGENRFQRMKTSHPNQYKYCIDTLGCGRVLDFIGINYR